MPLKSYFIEFFILRITYGSNGVKMFGNAIMCKGEKFHILLGYYTLEKVL
jgi:hypothetical protein